MILIDLIDATGGWIFFSVILLLVIGIVVLTMLLRRPGHPLHHPAAANLFSE